jgi:predicted RNA-binding protein Jag
MTEPIKGVLVERERRPERRSGDHRKPEFEMDETAKERIDAASEHFRESLDPFRMEGLNPYQRKGIHRHYERMPEYQVRTLRDEGDEVILIIYPVGHLQRNAETVLQEVLMTGERRILPPMGSFERFIVHEYLKNRGGVRTESYGEGVDRHVEIFPIFGRTPKKAKRRLTR